MNVSIRVRSYLRIACIPVLALAILAPYFDTASRLVKGWFTYEEAHKLILLAIAVYLLWMNKDQLKKTSPQPAIGAGLLVTVFGCLILLAGKVSNTFLIQDVSLPLTIIGIIILVGGWRYAKLTWLPVAYLLFVFEFFDELLSGIAIYLQYTAAWVAFVVLKLAGMPVIISGERLQLPHVILDVARGCSGINHIVALTAIAVPVAFARQRSSLARIALIVFAFLIGNFANGLRIAVIGLWSAHNPGSVHGPYDIFYVSSTFFFGMILFFAVSWLIGRYWPHPRKNQETNAAVLDEPHGKRQYNGTACAVSAGLGVVVLCAAWFALFLFEPRPVALKNALSTFPLTVGNWSGQALLGDKSPLKVIDADKLISRVYTDKSSGVRARLDIAYFENQNETKKIVSYKTGWLYDNRMEMVPVSTGKGVVYVAKTRSKTKDWGPETVYFWYDLDGKVTANRYEAKARTIMDAVTKRQTNGAITRLSFPASQNTTDEKALLDALVPMVREFFERST